MVALLSFKVVWVKQKQGTVNKKTGSLPKRYKGQKLESTHLFALIILDWSNVNLLFQTEREKINTEES